MRKPSLFILLFALINPCLSDETLNESISVKVNLVKDEVVVDVVFDVIAKPEEVWDVLIDFDHMANFISNLKSSKIIESKDNVVTVEQKGLAKYGVLSFPFESVREVHLTPKTEIQTHMISGTMHKYEGLVQIKTEGAVTEVTYHADSIPGVWIPPVVGKGFIVHETQEQFLEIKQEIMRRRDGVKSS